jgi:hypothetical protein
MKKKITTELYQFRKVGQMCDYAAANRYRFAPDTPGAAAVEALISTVDDLKVQTALQASLENRLVEVSRLRLEARQELRQDVDLLYLTARAVAAAKPSFDEKFQSSLWGEPKLLNAARAAVRDAAPSAETFVKHAMPPDFLETLNRKIRELERAREEFANGKVSQSRGEKELQESLQKAVAAASGFDAVMRNTFRDDRLTLDAWQAACRVRYKRKKTEDKEDPDTKVTDANGKDAGAKDEKIKNANAKDDKVHDAKGKDDKPAAEPQGAPKDSAVEPERKLLTA